MKLKLYIHVLEYFQTSLNYICLAMEARVLLRRVLLVQSEGAVTLRP